MGLTRALDRLLVFLNGPGDVLDRTRCFRSAFNFDLNCQIVWFSHVLSQRERAHRQALGIYSIRSDSGLFLRCLDALPDLFCFVRSAEKSDGDIEVQS